MDQINVTDETVLSTLRAVVAEQPDYVYAAPDHMVKSEYSGTCFYVHRTGDVAEPGCLVGHVLHRLGVPLSDLERFEGTGASSPVYSLLCILGDRDVDAAQALSTAQYLQDQGAPWGEALADALDD